MLSRYKKVSQQQLSETVRNYMYAIIKTGGKQYRVSEGDLLKVELLGDVKVGDKVPVRSARRWRRQGTEGRHPDG